MTPCDTARRLRETHGFGGLVTRVNDLIRQECSEFLAAQELPTSERKDTKAFKDAIWGMVDLERREWTVLDSPPLQRLRRIRQLGLTFVTYPTGGYSRFEHTIGAVHQAERMLQTIESRSDVQAGPMIAEQRAAIRLAALVHDVGHMPLSHVTERAFSQAECMDAGLLDEIEEWYGDVAETLEVPAPKVAECLSVALVLTDAFREVVITAGYSEEEWATAALAIVGCPPSFQLAFVAQVVTNVIDADKLDYMFRDSAATRVPLGVDLERLLYKLKCVPVGRDRVPGKLKKMAAGPDEQAWVLATDVAGMRLAYDMAIARTMLFDRIYLHHKTRAAERLAISIIRESALHPAELLGHDDGLFSRYSELGGDADRWAEQLRLRQLPRRAFALGYSVLRDEAPRVSDGGPVLPENALAGWRELQSDLEDATARAALEVVLLDRARELAGHLGKTFGVDRVWLDTLPDKTREPHNDDPELLLQRPDGTTHPGTAFPAEAAAFAHSPGATSYIYASGTTAELQLVHLAAELEFATRYSLIFGRPAADYAKVDYSSLEQLKRSLEEATPAIYEQYAQLRPRSLVLQSQHMSERLSTIADRVHQFHVKDEVRITAARVAAFLDQFPERLVEPAVQMLEHLQFVGRDVLGERFIGGLNGAVPDHAVMVPLTSRLGKSASHMSYFFEDAASGLPVLSLREALRTDSPIVLFDDVLISGTQASDTLRVWFGEEQVLDEDLDEPLTEDERERLVARELYFRFAYGFEPGIAALAEAAQAHGLDNDVAAVVVTPQVDPFTQIDGGDDLRAHLREVGKQLLLSTKAAENPERWTPERCEDRALGYGNLSQLVVLPYNTPTGTITALWKSGTYGSAPWLPLLPRRGEFGEL